MGIRRLVDAVEQDSEIESTVISTVGKKGSCTPSESEVPVEEEYTMSTSYFGSKLFSRTSCTITSCCASHSPNAGVFSHLVIIVRFGVFEQKGIAYLS